MTAGDADVRALGGVAPAEIGPARLQLHWAAQVPAAVGHSLVPAAPDNSHASLTWLPREAVLASQPLANGRRLALQPARMMLLVLDTDGLGAESMLLDSATLGEAMQWAAARAGVETLDRPAHDLPEHPVGSGDRFRFFGQPQAFEELALWYAAAASALAPWSRQDNAGAVRCWPHHLDIATLIGLDAGGGDNARSIGLGMTPGDPQIEEPYYYVLPWPRPQTEALPRLAGGGRWQTSGFVGAVLPATEIVRDRDTSAQAGRVAEFLESAVAASHALLRTT